MNSTHCSLCNENVTVVVYDFYDILATLSHFLKLTSLIPNHLGLIVFYNTPLYCIFTVISVGLC